MSLSLGNALLGTTGLSTGLGLSVGNGLAFLGFGGFSPASLFAAGEQGAWYDPSDFSTLFQDSAGTTPVTAVEQPVGRMLDKSGNNNHATQSTSASRPVLSARVNFLTKTEEFDDAVWTKQGLLAFGSGSVVNAAVAPNGTLTADLITISTANSSHGVDDSLLWTAVNGTSYTASISVKKPPTNSVRYLQITFGSVTFGTSQYATFDLDTGTVSGSASGTASILDQGGGWYRCSFTAAAIGSGPSEVFFVTSNTATGRGPTYAGDGVSGVYIWGADVRPTNNGVGLPAYQRVNTATDYDTTGFPIYLRFDGTDDGMVTGTITPGIDKAQVFAGVRKLSNLADQIILETSVNLNSNAGSIYLAGPISSGPVYLFNSKGSDPLFGSPATATGFPAPITSVVTGTSDIAGDITNIRVDGVQSGQSTLNQGTGNYLAYPLYIGRRGGTTLPFNGRLYSLIVRFGANLSAQQISDTETWVNSKTRAY